MPLQARLQGPDHQVGLCHGKWNDGTVFPIQAGHPCLGCTEPDFWDNGGFYKPLSAPAGNYRQAGYAAIAGGAALGVAGGVLARSAKAKAVAAHEVVDAHDLEKTS